MIFRLWKTTHTPNPDLGLVIPRSSSDSVRRTTYSSEQQVRFTRLMIGLKAVVNPVSTVLRSKNLVWNLGDLDPLFSERRLLRPALFDLAVSARSVQPNTLRSSILSVPLAAGIGTRNRAKSSTLQLEVSVTTVESRITDSSSIYQSAQRQSRWTRLQNRLVSPM